ncbi:hypothetical protein DFR58_109130 [Anaerobacterium chartisolvens]|uniref:Uncharacterized protein n=1 Tax=Anaerobacterium chartisolvens TaxID=1297424 RepID=A0A369B5X9_9FIRM|nr:hypothetical protein [Anaerobacterium chartisolvens]RCX16903.1 hypothetical protein DFR58_109130 [Anaerobacterium chartisolvens]
MKKDDKTTGKLAIVIDMKYNNKHQDFAKVQELFKKDTRTAPKQKTF